MSRWHFLSRSLARNVERSVNRMVPFVSCSYKTSLQFSLKDRCWFGSGWRYRIESECYYRKEFQILKLASTECQLVTTTNLPDILIKVSVFICVFYDVSPDVQLCDYCWRVTRIHKYVRKSLPTYLPTYIHTHIHTYIHTFIHMHSYIPTYLFTYLLTYVIKTNIRTHTTQWK